MRVRLGRVRFKVRALILLIAVCAVSIGVFFESIRRPFRAERELAADVKKIGGSTFAVDYQPVWLKAALNGQDARNVTVVNLEGTRVTDDDLARLVGFSRLGGLHLTRTRISDAGFTHINRLAGLVQLEMGETKVHDIQLVKLSELQSINLSRNRIRHLELIDLPSLESLNLGFTDVDDTNLPSLRGLANLGSLDLRSTRVSDAGLEQLKALTRLKTLYVYDTKVTDAGVADLKRALPGVKVFLRPHP